ncbi:MAG: pyrroloquinoline quinone-dependent dehydrogenase [Pseudomonadota bacterium]
MLALLCGCGGDGWAPTTPASGEPRVTSAWPEYGGGGGRRYVDLDGIHPGNVAALEVAWVYRTGDVSDGGHADVPASTAFEATPILADGHLVFCTPFNRVLAVDPLTGGEIWRFESGIDLGQRYANQLVCRGVAQWRDPRRARGAECATRIFTATNDAFLIALDAATGRVCRDFGDDGRIDLAPGAGEQAWLGEYQVTSAPTVIGDRVVVGAAVSDNQRIDAPSGVVRAFDARSGRREWAWDLAPPGFDYDAPGALVSEEGFALGTPNVWGTMTADQERDLLFVPTGNPAPDYYRRGGADMDHYGSAVVALDGRSGDVVWHFNTVRNDFWDYDVGAQPALVTLDVDGGRVPALIQGTKTGFVFVLNRETGAPVVDYRLQAVPRAGPLAAELSPVQPVPPAAFRVSRETAREDAWGLTFWDRDHCRRRLEEMRVGPVFTPVTEQWTLVAPGNAGGINWGGVAVDPERGVIVARSTHLPFQVRLIPRAEYVRARERQGADLELAPQRGTPYAMARKPFLSSLGLPCTRPPWGTLTAIDIGGRKRLWDRPHGTVADLAAVPVPWEAGVPGLGQGVVTSSGLVFIGGAMENAVRAYDVESGRELWRGRLPAAPLATPMSYEVELDSGERRQLVVVAAGGYPDMGVPPGDYLVAFALPVD